MVLKASLPGREECGEYRAVQGADSELMCLVLRLMVINHHRKMFPFCPALRTGRCSVQNKPTRFLLSVLEAGINDFFMIERLCRTSCYQKHGINKPQVLLLEIFLSLGLGDREVSWHILI